MLVNIQLGDCLNQMRILDKASIDSIVTDPPYGLSFMGKGWDHGVPGVEFWAEALRVAKPGAHLLAFGGTRTYHRLACAIEDAGWEIRDCVMWVYGSGFPKSHDVSKAIDKAAGAEREKEWKRYTANTMAGAYDQRPWLDEARKNGGRMIDTSNPATDAARQWSGWGTALKPAWEPIIVARKPLVGTVAENVLAHGTGGINVDGCRVGTEGGTCRDGKADKPNDAGWENMRGHGIATLASGRWPANVIHDGSDSVVGLFPQCKSGALNQASVKAQNGIYGKHDSYANPRQYEPDSGSVARFFKCCPPDTTCPLCCLPYAEACDTMQAWKNTLASIAEKRGWTSQATSEFIARVSAIGPASERIVPHVKSAGNLCDSCAISIAVALVATKTSAFSSEELQATLASTGSYSDSILIPSLASFAELWASIDTIPTTNSLSLLFGSVRDAIASSTRQDTKGKAEPRSAPSRFAYVPKASKADRDEGCEGLPVVRVKMNNGNDADGDPVSDRFTKMARNTHPTVKPTALMRYLCRLVTPPGGVVLDPFTGSGSTGKAAIIEGFRFIGIEREAEYVEIAKARVASAIEKRQSVGIGGQCVSGLPIGNGDSSNIVSSLGDSCDAGPECGTRSNLHNNKLNKAICTTSDVQRDLFEGLE